MTRLSLLACAAAWVLAGCGGGSSTTTTTHPALADVPVDVSLGVQAEPSFHRLPMALAEPADSDADGSASSALQAAASVTVPAELQALSTQRLTDEMVSAYRAQLPQDTALAAKPMASTAAVVYTPAQIRAAYRLAAVPASTNALGSSDAAALGAGQTIYIVDAYHHPNALADLGTFSKKFGLPTCATANIPAGTAVLAAANASAGCTVSVVYAAAGATVGTKAPAYNVGWAQEIALDIQWAHAIAPLARIVLIEAADANTSTLQNAVALANRLGAGAVSMSFGSPEGSWSSGTATSFAAAGMSYLAATGDGGAAVAWPAVMGPVFAVGGTTLNYNGSTRAETAWAKTGGGISAWMALPAYQSALTIPGEPAAVASKRRSVADLSFNADPMTGQYAAFTASGAAQASWYAFGGTSISTPQWAGLVAVSNAQRALRGKAGLGNFHAQLYGSFAPGSGNWQQSFYDIVGGSNGTCKACYAGSGYDSPTGLGTPRADALLPLLAAL